jgi:hypothetical protein
MKAGWLAAGLVVATALGRAHAAPLKIVEVSAPAINCMFHPSCIVTVTDTSAALPLPGAAGSGFLQSRTIDSITGSPAGGRHGFLYRIDLRQAYGITAIPCLQSMSLAFGAPSTLDYDTNGIADEQVFVITQGGLGSVKPTSAERIGNIVTFHFGAPVCAGGSPGSGETTYFFGLAAWGNPTPVAATVKDLTAVSYTLGARAPQALILPRPRLVPLL